MKKLIYTCILLLISGTCFLLGCGISYYMISASKAENFGRKTIETIAASPEETSTKQEDDISKNEKDEKEVIAVMKSYYEALRNGKRDQIKELTKDKEDVPSEETLSNMTQYIKDYRQLQCYLKKTSASKGYIVFLSYKVKLYESKVLVPGVTQYYVEPMGREWKICLDKSKLSEEVQTEMDASLQMEDVKNLIEKTKKGYEKALEQDEKLKKYFED